jgi:2-dehydro-3-deoxygluconokinase
VTEKAFDIVAMGEGLIEFNQTTPGQPQYLQSFGGDTSNAVVAAAKAGARCAMLSSVGNDSFGQLLMNFWQLARVNTAQVAINSVAPTGLYFVTHSEQGHQFEYRRAGSAAAHMVLNDAQCALLSQTRWLHGSGITLAISQTAREQYARAVALARASGAQISFDANLRLRLWSLGAAREAMLPAIAACDLFLPSIDDVVQLSGLQEPQAIVRWCHDLGARQVVLKMGERGVLVSDGQSTQSLAPMRVQAVDATGAGDCFAGNLLARLCAGDSLYTAARYANAAAALSVQSYGAVAGFPTPDAVLTLLAQNPKTPGKKQNP